MRKTIFVSVAFAMLLASCGSSKPAAKRTVDQDKDNFEKTFDKEMSK